MIEHDEMCVCKHCGNIDDISNYDCGRGNSREIFCNACWQYTPIIDYVQQDTLFTYVDYEKENNVQSDM